MRAEPVPQRRNLRRYGPAPEEAPFGTVDNPSGCGHRFAHSRLPRAGLLPLLLSATNTALQFVVLAAISQRRLSWTGAIGPTGQRWTGPNCEVPPRACPPGLEGPRCSTDVDECASFPCRKSHDRRRELGRACRFLTAMLARAENGATCLESSVHGPVATGFYQCECAVGWHGANCASDVRPMAILGEADQSSATTVRCFAGGRVHLAAVPERCGVHGGPTAPGGDSQRTLRKPLRNFLINKKRATPDQPPLAAGMLRVL